MIVSWSRYPVPLISKVKLRDAALCIFVPNFVIRSVSWKAVLRRFNIRIHIYTCNPCSQYLSIILHFEASGFFLIISFEFLILPTCEKRKPVPVFWIACFDRPGVYKKKKSSKVFESSEFTRSKTVHAFCC